ncbi:MAG: protease HtpX [Candidatus Competibacteraceae bacterium]|jgi:heat shock protein HtpX|nr:protease HtpX [Candidatus Competibacteraceae bacterium]
MKRVALFLLTNFAILVVLGIVVNLFGAGRFISATGLDLQSLFIFAAVFGMGGALISLAMSKWIAKRSTGAQIITQPRNQTERWLVETVHIQAKRAGIGMPEVAVFDSPAPNAFATGANRNNALVAVSTGLLQHMNQDEVEAVLGHEVSHVANGDMVTLTLLQGVVNTFVIFLARVVGFMVDRALSGNNQNYRGPGIGYWVTSMIAEVLLGFLATMIVMWFSRYREFRADAGGADLAGRNKMIAALARLQQASEPSRLPSEMAAFGINGGLGTGLKKLFMSHPPLEARIAALRDKS